MVINPSSEYEANLTKCLDWVVNTGKDSPSVYCMYLHRVVLQIKWDGGC